LPIGIPTDILIFVARSATILSLVPQENINQDKLRSLLNVERLALVQAGDVRKRGALAGLRYLRLIHKKNKSKIFAIRCSDWKRQSQRSYLYCLACLMPGEKIVIENSGKLVKLSWKEFLSKELPDAFSQFSHGRRLVAETSLRAMHAISKPLPPRTIKNYPPQRIAYFRTDLWTGVKAGGSVGHVAGVINAFSRMGIDVYVLSYEKPLLIDDNVKFILIPPRDFFVNQREFQLLDYNRVLVQKASKALTETPPDAVYARYSLNCWAPLALAKNFNVPLILEFNGSEVWIEQNWGRGLRYPGVAYLIEELMLRSADLIVAVSNALKQSLLERGIDPSRILLNPNAVDPDIFNPHRFSPIEINELKAQLGIPPDRIVAGFIGTFSPWHGVEVLADAIPLALNKCPNLHFLLIGSGPLLDKVKNQLESTVTKDRVTFTGIVPQADAPRYLMCADFFLSPHVQNPDGSEFFGSPTKLFEYMALGKGIIASNLAQLGEVLKDGVTARLIPPGNPTALAEAISEFYNNPALSEKLGAAARREAVEKYTWKTHTEKILEALKKLSKNETE